MDEFRNRLVKMKRHFSKWARRRNIFAYRIYDRDIPQYPFSIDIYENNLYVCEFLNESVLARKDYDSWREEILNIIHEVTEITPDKIFIRQRMRQKGGTQYEKLSSESEFLEVREGGLKFLVNLKDYLDTGLFLDHRIMRNEIRLMSESKNFLNLFCYTGSFSVYSASGGAKKTTSVDTSGVYLEWAEKNFLLNNLDLKNHEFIKEDSRLFLENCPENTYDLIFCDPPVFSSGKKHFRDFDVLRDHPELIDGCMRVLKPGGSLFFSTNFKKFKIRWDGKAEDISLKTIPEDFKNKQIHVCYKIDKN